MYGVNEKNKNTPFHFNGVKWIKYRSKKKSGNNASVQLNKARSRHQKVFPEERNSHMRDQLTAPILTHTTERLLENINNDGPPK